VNCRQCLACSVSPWPTNSQGGSVQFAQILFSLTAFVLLPFTCQHIKQRSNRLFTAIVALALLATCTLLLNFAWQLAVVYLVLQACLLFLCPWWLLHIEKFKAKINGPWDEAVPRLTTLVRQTSLENQLPQKNSGQDVNVSRYGFLAYMTPICVVQVCRKSRSQAQHPLAAGDLHTR
jgi:lysylphosphatidylglycerol synthetase-like protein (DUF2156 family)